ncbi:hypothetical protein B6D29_03645 [Microgenomates bacterium UTCPR1]|nr:MAG: hypothetical protein B6D29_03645 [Microgenomates bacterium UTCPR1]
MKGLVLAGGLATRLRPLTLVTNKHLLPVYNKPMIYFPILSLINAGVKEILISTSPDHAGRFAELLKGGSDFGAKFYYSIQDNPKGGIANAIGLAKEFADNEKLAVVLGDNIFSYNLKPAIDRFRKREKGAVIFGIRMSKMESKHYGVVEIDSSGKVISIEEKPLKPKSDIAQSGIYFYDNRVFDFIKKLKPSDRGELEVTDLNNFYLKEGSLECDLLDWWIDAGTSHSELLRANNLVAEKVKAGEL